LTAATAFAAVLLHAVIAVTLAGARASTHAVSITCAGDWLPPTRGRREFICARPGWNPISSWSAVQDQQYCSRSRIQRTWI